MPSRKAQRRSQPRTQAGRDRSARAQPAPAAAGTAAQAPSSNRTERVKLLDELKRARGSDLVIAYVTSSRPGLNAVMSLDAVRRIADHLPSQKVKQLDLFIASDGGDSIVPWRLMTLLREYGDRVDLLVPHRAFSAATLAAFGADRVVMHPMGMLGPIDPTVHDFFGPIDPETGQRPGVSVEDVASYNTILKDLGITGESEKLQAFEILAKEVHPLTLGRVRRGSSQARMLGGKLLRLRDPSVSDEAVKEIVDALTEKLYYHGHPINRHEALDLGLHVDIPAPEVERAMWQLNVAYEEDLEMEVPFDQIGYVASIAGLPGGTGTTKTARYDGVRRVIVESESRADVFAHDLEITLGRNDEGAVVASLVALDTRWATET